MRYFAFPYFSRDIAEFWRRWHISLSTWFRDYVYIPLGGSRGRSWMKVRNIFIIFIVSGFWHGANWTFIIWGGLNALYFLPLLLLDKNRKNMEIVAKGNYLPTFKEFIGISVTYGLTILAWIFFRSENITHAIQYLLEIFSPSLFTLPNFLGIYNAITTSILVVLFILFEWLNREKQHALALDNTPTPIRWGIYYTLAFCISHFGGNQETFIYFQF
jgi:D-alanyl-lipoteichoic acid acyltransferase DltB (MBOAT superfamily)